MAKSKPQSANSINIKYSSATGELVIDGETMGYFSDDAGNHPTPEEMLDFVRVLQQRLPYASHLVNNLDPTGGAEIHRTEEDEQDD